MQEGAVAAGVLPLVHQPVHPRDHERPDVLLHRVRQPEAAPRAVRALHAREEPDRAGERRPAHGRVGVRV